MMDSYLALWSSYFDVAVRLFIRATEYFMSSGPQLFCALVDSSLMKAEERVSRMPERYSPLLLIVCVAKVTSLQASLVQFRRDVTASKFIVIDA